MPSHVYPFDDTGEKSSNLVLRELRTLTEVNAAPYRIFIPEFPPFYLTNLRLEHVDTVGNITPMQEGTDYYPCLPYMAAQRSIGKPVYGGISIINEHLQGTVMITYQTVGGKWVVDRNHVYTQLLTTVYNQRTTWWDRLTNVQDLFPPSQHSHVADDIEGHKDLLKKLDEVRIAILSNHNDLPTLRNELVAHIGTHGNPHHLHKNDIGLGLIENLRFATDTEVLQHEDLDAYISLRQLNLVLKKLNLI